MNIDSVLDRIEAEVDALRATLLSDTALRYSDLLRIGKQMSTYGEELRSTETWKQMYQSDDLRRPSAVNEKFSAVTFLWLGRLVVFSSPSASPYDASNESAFYDELCKEDGVTYFDQELGERVYRPDLCPFELKYADLQQQFDLS